MYIEKNYYEPYSYMKKVANFQQPLTHGILNLKAISSQSQSNSKPTSNRRRIKRQADRDLRTRIGYHELNVRKSDCWLA